MIEIDAALIELSAYTLQDVITSCFQLVGIFTAVFSVLLFGVWGAWHSIRFMRQILKT